MAQGANEGPGPVPSSLSPLVLAGAACKNNANASGVFIDTNDNTYESPPAKINADGTYKGGVFLQKKTGGSWTDKTEVFDTTVTTKYDAADGTPQSGTSQFGGRVYGPTNNNLKDLWTAGH